MVIRCENDTFFFSPKFRQKAFGVRGQNLHRGPPMWCARTLAMTLAMMLMSNLRCTTALRITPAPLTSTILRRTLVVTAVRKMLLPAPSPEHVRPARLAWPTPGRPSQLLQTARAYGRIHSTVASVSGVKMHVGAHEEHQEDAAVEPGEQEPRRSCWVRCVADEPHLSVAIEIGGKESILHRMQEDPLQTTLDRLEKLVKERLKDRTRKGELRGKKKEKKVKGKGKGRRRQAEAEAKLASSTAEAADTAAPPGAQSIQGPLAADGRVPKIWVADARGREVPADSLNRHALVDGHTLHVGGEALEIKCNGPSVKSIFLRMRPFQGFPLRPEYECEFNEAASTSFRWWRVSSHSPAEGDGESERVGIAVAAPDPVAVGVGECYTPTAADIGVLCVLCLPRSGIKLFYVRTCPMSVACT